MSDIEKEQKKIYDDQTKAFMKDRKANAAEKIAPLKEEVAHKVGDTVYATHPVKRYTTMTGKVTHVGRTLTTLTHKDGTTGTYPHHDVNKDYEVLHPNPYTKERDKRANESVDEAYTPGKTVYTSHMDKVLKGKVVEPDEEDKKFTIVNINGKRHSVHNDHIHSRAEHAGFMLEDTKPMSFSQFVKEGVFDWKANKSEVDWSDKKDKKTEKSAEGGTIHKARETERNAETGGKAAKKSVGRPAGAYQGSYKIDKAKRADPKNKEELSKKVMAAKAEGFAIRKDYKGAMNAAIKKRQEELWNEKK